MPLLAQPPVVTPDADPPGPSLDVWDVMPDDERGATVDDGAGASLAPPGASVAPNPGATAGFPVDPLMTRALPLDAARWDVVEEGGCRIEQAVPGVGRLRFVAPAPVGAPLQAGFVAERSWPPGTSIVVRVLPPPAVVASGAAEASSASGASGERDPASAAPPRPLARWSVAPVPEVSLGGASGSDLAGRERPFVADTTDGTRADADVERGSAWPPRADRRLRRVESTRGRGLVPFDATLGDALFDALLAGDDVWIGLPPAGAARPATDPARDADRDWAVFRGLRFALAAGAFAECRESQF